MPFFGFLNKDGNYEAKVICIYTCLLEITSTMKQINLHVDLDE